MAYEEGYTGRRVDRVTSHKVSKDNTLKKTKEESLHGVDTYQNYDSPLLEQESRIPISYDVFFRDTLPKGVSIREHVMDVLSDRARSLIGIEFGGPGSRTFSGFPGNYFERTLGVTLLDHRDKSKKDFDNSRSHTVIATDPIALKNGQIKEREPLIGDLTNPQTLEEVRSWLNGRKADLIIERMMGPLLSVPKDPYYMANYISEWYRLLSQKGMMFIEVPPFMEKLLEPWIRHVTEVSGGSIEIQGANGNYDFNPRFRLQKKDGAPDVLPLLTPNQVKDAYKKIPEKHSALRGLLSRIGFLPNN